MTDAATSGITDEARDQWWRATVQAVAGLTHLRGSARALPLTSRRHRARQHRHPHRHRCGGRRAVLPDRPGITGSRTVVVGTDGVLATRVTLPAATGPATYTLTGRDGALTHAVAVAAPPTEPRAARSAGVRLVGPTGFRAAGSTMALEVLGAAPGAASCSAAPASPTSRSWPAPTAR